MTQVQMTDQQLNRALAELMGYMVECTGNCYWIVEPGGKTFADPFSKNSEDIAWTWSPKYCTDPAASLEVQAKAIEVDYKSYIKHLLDQTKGSRSTIDGVVAELLIASPRERAEAAYITLSSK